MRKRSIQVAQSVSGLQVRVMHIEERIEKVERELHQVGEKRLVRLEDMTSVSQKIGMDLKKDMDTTFKMIRDEMIEVVSKKIGNELKGDMDMAFKKAKDELTTVASKLSTDESDERRVMKDEEEFKKLAKEVNDMKIEMDSQVRKTVMIVKEEVKEALEIEIRKMNLVIHGVPDIDAEHDFYQVAAILGNGLHMDFDRHVSSMTRIWKIEENKPRPLRIVVKSLDGKK